MSWSTIVVREALRQPRIVVCDATERKLIPAASAAAVTATVFRAPRNIYGSG